MRPRKVVLTVAFNERKLSIQSFVLETWGYRPFAARTAFDAMRVLQEEAPIDLLILNLPLTCRDELLLAAYRSQPGIRTVAINDTPAFDPTCKVDVFLPSCSAVPSELKERLKILTAKKRGPKKKPIESVASDHKEVRYG